MLYNHYYYPPLEFFIFPNLKFHTHETTTLYSPLPQSLAIIILSASMNFTTFKYFMQVESYGICLFFVTGLLHLACLNGSSMLQHMSEFYSFLKQYVYTIFCLFTSQLKFKFMITYLLQTVNVVTLSHSISKSILLFYSRRLLCHT